VNHSGPLRAPPVGWFTIDRALVVLDRRIAAGIVISLVASGIVIGAAWSWWVCAAIVTSLAPSTMGVRFAVTRHIPGFVAWWKCVALGALIMAMYAGMAASLVASRGEGGPRALAAIAIAAMFVFFVVLRGFFKLTAGEAVACAFACGIYAIAWALITGLLLAILVVAIRALVSG